eukprot:215721-Prymnesium_polylepis.1
MSGCECGNSFFINEERLLKKRAGGHSGSATFSGALNVHNNSDKHKVRSTAPFAGPRGVSL